MSSQLDKLISSYPFYNPSSVHGLSSNCLLLENLSDYLSQVLPSAISLSSVEFQQAVRECYRQTALSIAEHDLEFYRELVGELTAKHACKISKQGFEEACHDATFKLNPQLFELLLSKINKSSCLKSITRFLNELQRKFQDEYTSFSSEPFDQVFVSEAKKLTSVEDFYDFLYGLEVDEQLKGLIVEKMHQFQEILEKLLEDKAEELQKKTFSAEFEIPNHQSSPSFTMLEHHDDDTHQRHIHSLEVDIEHQSNQIQQLQEKLTQTTNQLHQTELQIQQLHKDNRDLSLLLAGYHAQNKLLKQRQKSFQTQAQTTRMQWQRHLNEYQESFTLLQQKCLQVEAQLFQQRRLHEQLKLNQMGHCPSEPNIYRRNDSNSDLLRQLSKAGSIQQPPFILIEDIGAAEHCEYVPSRKNSTVGETLNTKQSLTEGDQLKVAYLSPHAIEEVQRLMLSSRHFEKHAEIFIEPVVVLTEEEVHSTKLLCAGSESLCIYSQDQHLYTKIQYENIREVVLPAQNLMWVLIRTSKDLFIEMARREEFVVRVLGVGVPVTAGLMNHEIQIEYYAKKKTISELPREIYNPLRYISTFSQQSGHLYFKPNSNHQKQEYKQYYSVLLGDVLLLFSNSTIDSLFELVPILQTTQLMVQQSSNKEFYVWRLANPGFQSYSLGFASVRIAELWIAALQAAVGRLQRCNMEVRVQQVQTIRVLQQGS